MENNHHQQAKGVRKMETYLVTGAAGHLGNTLVNRLVEQGHAVRALILPGDRRDMLPQCVRVYEGDVRDKASMQAFFSAENAIVIHAAGIVSIATRYRPEVFEVNVRGTQNVLALAKEHRAKKFVYVSSVHAIPTLAKGQTMEEVSQFSSGAVSGTYAKTKAAATAWVLAAKGINVSVVHPSGICGPYDYGRGHVTQLVTDYCSGGLAAGVQGGYDFVDVRDVVDGILHCCMQGGDHETYILSNRRIELTELFELLHRVTGKRRITTFLPLWFAKSTASLSELYYKLLHQPPLFTAYSLDTLTDNSCFSHEKATKAFGYQPRPFEETLRDTVDWLREQSRVS